MENDLFNITATDRHEYSTGYLLSMHRIYRKTHARLKWALKDFRPGEYNLLPYSDSFSVNEIAFYMADAEMEDSIQLREILSGKQTGGQQRPVDLWSKLLQYQEKKIYNLSSSLSLLGILRNINVKLLGLVIENDSSGINYSLFKKEVLGQFMEAIIARDEKCISQLIGRKKLFEKLVDPPPGVLNFKKDIA